MMQYEVFVVWVSHMKTQWKAFLGALVCAILWGSAFPAIKLVYSEWHSQGEDITLWMKFWFAGVRFVIAGGLLLFVAKEPRKQWRDTPRHLIVAMTLTQTVLQYVLFYTALSYVSGSLGALLTASGSFLWLLLAPMFGHSVKGGRKVWLILSLGALGVGLAVYSPSDASVAPFVGISLLLLANLCGVFAILTFGKVKKTMDARASTGYALLLGGLVLCLLGSPVATESRTLFSSFVCAMTLYLACVSAMAFALWYELSTRYSLALLATFRLMIPIMGVLLSILFLEGETFTLSILGGAFIVCVAMYLSQKSHS